MKSAEALGKKEIQNNFRPSALPFEISRLDQVAGREGYLFNRSLVESTFKIIWVTRGKGVHYIDFLHLDVEDNSLFFIRPRQVHQLCLSGQGEGYVIRFTESFLCLEDQDRNSIYHTSLFKLFASAREIIVRNDFLHMKNIAEEMVNEFNGENLFRAEMLRRLFNILLIYVTRQMEGKFETIPQSRKVEIVQQFMEQLERNYKKLKMVSEYAMMLSVSPNYLNEIVKKKTGFSAGHHIRQRIVLEAKRQAAYSDNCMKEIAYRLGFYDAAHFSKFFKNTTGMNFSAFKKGNICLEAYPSPAN